MVFPHRFQQHGAGNDLIGVAHQVFQQLVFARLQFDRSVGAAYAARQPVQLQIADPQQMQARAGAIDELLASGALDDPSGLAKDDITRELEQLASTSEVGRFSIYRTENKGRINKRLYVRLD